MTPGPFFEKEGDVAEYLKTVLCGFDNSKVCAFKQKFMSACDGKATERILSELGI